VRGGDWARQLRHDQTDAERLLWRHLRARRLGGHKFRRQCPIGGYIVDLLCLERRVVVEIDGGQHSASLYDRRRTSDLESMGMIVIRFWNVDVLLRTDAVLGEILATLDSPHPNPLHARGERESIARHRVFRCAKGRT